MDGSDDAPEPSVDAAAVELLQSAIRKLKAGLDDFEADLQSVRRRLFADQGVQSSLEVEKLPIELRPQNRDYHSFRSEGYEIPQQPPESKAPQRTGIEFFWKDRLGPATRERCKMRLEQHERQCLNFVRKLEHLEDHYNHIGGGERARKESEELRTKMKAICGPLKALLGYKGTDNWSDLFDSVQRAYNGIFEGITAFESSLYKQKHAFHFRGVREWRDYNEASNARLETLCDCVQFEDLIKYLYTEFMDGFENAMAVVADELCRFGEKALPMFLADEKERDSTRYLNITTIATFFSSITATTLQMSISISQSSLWNVVNFFWFISLVFSVSSGVSSLVGMTWRKSSIYDTTAPPWLIELWLEKVLMIFLIVSAMMFIVGLNLFAYLSSQASFVSLLTNAFTGAHSLCLVVVVLWFIYHLKHESLLIKWAEGALFRRKKALLKRICQIYESDRGRHYRRNVCFAFGQDRLVFHLNWDLFWSTGWPSSPNRIAKVVRSAGCSAKSLFQQLKRRRLTESCQTDMEVIVEGEMTVEEVLVEYRQTLQSTFGTSERTDKSVMVVRDWMWNYVYDNDNLKLWLDRVLWGYPHLVHNFYSGLVDARKRNRGQKRMNLKDVASDVSSGEFSPPSGSSAVVWAHARAEDVNADYVKKGSDWYALFNPDKERSLDVSLVHTLRHESYLHCVRFSADGMYIAAGCFGGIAQIYETDTGAQICTLRDDETRGTLYSVCFSPECTSLAAAGKDKRIMVWNIEDKAIYHSFKGHKDDINCLDFSKDGRFIVSGSHDGTARVWYLETGDSTILDTNDSGDKRSKVWSVAILHDGMLIAGGCEDGVIRIWDVRTGRLVGRLAAHGSSVTSLALSPDDKGLFSGSWDKTIKHWDLTPFVQCDSRAVPAKSLVPMSISEVPGPETIDQTRDTGEHDSICTLTFDGHINSAESVAISHDGQWVLSGSLNEGVLFWDARNAQAHFSLHGQKESLASMDVSPTGSIFATGNSDGTTRIWRYSRV